MLNLSMNQFNQQQVTTLDPFDMYWTCILAPFQFPSVISFFLSGQAMVIENSQKHTYLLATGIPNKTNLC